MVPYYDSGGAQRSAQLTKAWSARGYNVYYAFRQHAAEAEVPKVAIPAVLHGHVKRVGRKATERLRPEDLMVVEAPAQEFAVLAEAAKARGARVIYENIDDWETSLGAGLGGRVAREKLLAVADVWVGTARPLVKQLEGYARGLSGRRKPIIYVPNAVDRVLFDPQGGAGKPRPSDLITGERTLLYYGTLWGEWLDWELVFELARQRPKDAVNLVGDASTIPQVVRRAPKNVHFLGLKVQTELPAYLAHADVALLPFDAKNPIARAVSPLKIFEYIAMEKPVLSTSLPDIKGYPNVWFGDTAAAWLKHLDTVRRVDKAAARRFVAEQTWERRAAELMAAVYSTK
jgi:glycosyltransferase involved in cell wall biosynthesis